jgi:hypothetical protein
MIRIRFILKVQLETATLISVFLQFFKISLVFCNISNYITIYFDNRESELWKMTHIISHGCIIRNILKFMLMIPCGGGVEYLHRNPVSPRRRRKGKSRIWDSKVWSHVPRDSDSRMTALARASSNCKRETHPLIRESAPHQQSRNCPTVIKIWS